jgi:uncharacterized protein (DUF1800 family)
MGESSNKHNPFSSERSRISHLLRRAGFGASPAELDAAVTRGYDATLDLLLNPADEHDAADEKLDALTFQLNRIDEAQRWWLLRMRYTSRPLVEKMTLFWHNHFATGASKVNGRAFPLMRRQNDLFRAQGLGNFRDLLMSVSKDPAMLIWLDGRMSHKDAPNENYGRELLELFTTGIGHYSEDDVKSAARAFTGWSLTAQSEFVFRPADHDYGPKRFLGKTDNYNGDEIVNTLAAHPATAEFLAAKLVRFFVSDPPDQALVKDLAKTYLASHYDMRSVLRRMFKSDAFLSDASYHGLVKSPVELIAGTLRSLDIETTGQGLPVLLRSLGQELFNPPNVAGWPGGATWIATNTMLSRHNFANSIATAKTADSGLMASPQRLFNLPDGSTAADLAAALTSHLVDGDLEPEELRRLYEYSETSGGDLQVRGLVYLLLTAPVYQLN